MNKAGTMRQGANEIAGLIRQEITGGILAPRERLTPEEQWLRMRHLTMSTDTMLIYNKQHQQILNAIRTREPERAAATWCVATTPE